ncbi:hypothetical protein M2323_002740 [Rhodoblastus acidophilus]|uniref:hypothetical protein n=1 Tax=Rhodoblastus acidophilus TaxID=1074 RepID=UPI0022259776|nr:hypothetical protein [Rhodoblastus acidophilus]MCW2284906.1 hypothetical protein [Rhodoblastus acidophilus]MCW2333804.1 hypothetical protein [Rhodoblastus acidophilus]
MTDLTAEDRAALGLPEPPSPYAGVFAAVHAGHHADGARQLEAQHQEQQRRIAARNAAKAAADRQAFLASPAGKAEQQRREYRHAIMGLPEAQEHADAAILLALTHDANSLPPERAALILGGLPAENLEPSEPQTISQETADMSEPTLKRRAEIRLAALSHRADLGDHAARSEANKISYALKLAAEGMNLAAACQQLGVDLSKIQN